MIDRVKIRIVACRSIERSLINDCISFISKAEYIDCERLNVAPIQLADPFIWDDCFGTLDRCRKEANVPDDEFMILITNNRNENNWFSAFDETGQRNIFIQASDWESYIYTNKVNPIVYEIIANILQSLLSQDYEELNEWVHLDPIGCMNDLCEWKPDIQLKLKTGDICGDCLNSLKDKITTEVLKDTVRLFQLIRNNVVSTSEFFDPPTYELVFPSPLAITKRKISTTSDPLRKTLFAIDHFDMIIKVQIYFSLAIGGIDIEDFLQRNGLDNKPSLGSWVTALAALSKEMRGKEVKDINLSKIVETTKNLLSISEQGKLVQLRNEQRGHGYIHCHDHTYSQTYAMMEDLLKTLEEMIIDTFSRFKLKRALSISKKDRANYLLRMNGLIGSNLLFEEEQRSLKVNPDLIDGDIYLVNSDLSTWSQLSPYLVLDNCPECQHERLMIKDGDMYIDIREGHRVSLLNR